MPTNNKPTSKPASLASWLDRQSVTRLFYLSVVLCCLALILLTAALVSEHHHSIVQISRAHNGYPVGTSLSLGVATVSVDSVSYQSGQGPFQTPVGKKYAVLTLSVQNRSDKPITVLPTSDTYVKDAAGNTVYLTPFSLSAPFHAGELPAGETVRGQLSYLVPATGSLKFYIDAIWSGGVITYALR